MKSLLDFREADNTFTEWFCIETVDIGTNSWISPSFGSMSASEGKVTLCT